MDTGVYDEPAGPQQVVGVVAEPAGVLGEGPEYCGVPGVKVRLIETHLKAQVLAVQPPALHMCRVHGEAAWGLGVPGGADGNGSLERMERPAEHGVDHEFGQFGLLPVELELVVVAGGALVQGQGNCLEPEHKILSPASAPALLLLLLHILVYKDMTNK